MWLFKGKNKCDEFLNLLKYKLNIDGLLSLDKYISKKEYLPYLMENKSICDKLTTLDDEDVLAQWSKKNKADYKELKELLTYYKNTEYNINFHNEEFVKKHLYSDKQYLDELLIQDDPQIKLDEDQRKVVLSDEDYTLVIAGAGAGKTTTIEAKVKYLIEKQHIDPNRILIVSFTRKATKELQDRCRKLGLPVNISTFHGIANAIIQSSENEKHNIATGEFMFSSVKSFLIENANNEEFVKKVLLFFASYLQLPPGEENLAVLMNSLSKDNCTTLKSDIKNTIENYRKDQEKKRITIKDEKVKSIEECRIANFLFINGIDYEYEPVYKYGFEDSLKLYRPDFLIRQYDKEIYLEHFGITENGQNPRYTEEELELYKQHVNDKVLLHKNHGTKLIYTFSKYNDGRDVISHLKENLQKAGISFEYKNTTEIYNTLLKNMEDKYFNKFIQLVCVFIERFKTNNYSASKFDEWKISINDERTKLFIGICQQCYLAYMADLKNRNSIDFEDMINNAASIINKKIESGEKLPYDYIFVDEYQDISLQRFDLCERLSKCSNAKIVAVGDDWQSIFKFSGAKIELFTKFAEMMGYANIIKIVRTYRNSQELINIAGEFVMSNDDQIKKELRSSKSIEDPIILMSYQDYTNANDQDRQIDRLSAAIEKSLDMIVKNNGIDSSVLLIGRYGFEKYQLINSKKYFSLKDDNIISNKYPQLKITYLTAHSSKGLGYDNVIIINGKDAILGFPSKVVDDPVMKLVIKDTETAEYAEERRLFYVALTRTKNRVFIITPIHRPSKFILEIKDKFKNVRLDGEELSPVESLNNKVACPYCGYPLQKRDNYQLKDSQRLWVCSNDPEICGFVTNDLRGGRLSISKCPNCEDGYLVVKTQNNTGLSILGCTNYKADGSGCNTVMRLDNFTQDREEFAIKFYGKELDINNVVMCGCNFKKLVDIIMEIIIKYSQSELAVGPKIIFSLLSGEITSMTKKLKMDNDPYFGYLKATDRKKFYMIFNSLKENHFISVDTDDYGRCSVIRPRLNDEDYKAILASM